MVPERAIGAARGGFLLSAGILLIGGDCGPERNPEETCCCGVWASVVVGFAHRDEPAAGQIQVEAADNYPYHLDLDTLSVTGAQLANEGHDGDCNFELDLLPDGNADIVIEADYVCAWDEEEKRMADGCLAFPTGSDGSRLRTVIPRDWLLGDEERYWVTWDIVEGR